MRDSTARPHQSCSWVKASFSSLILKTDGVSNKAFNCSPSSILCFLQRLPSCQIVCSYRFDFAEKQTNHQYLFFIIEPLCVSYLCFSPSPLLFPLPQSVPFLLGLLCFTDGWRNCNENIRWEVTMIMSIPGVLRGCLNYLLCFAGRLHNRGKQRF